MVRETRHLWVGNLPDNIREDRIREHFKRYPQDRTRSKDSINAYGRVQSVKLLPRGGKEETGEMACTVAFMDIKSASKAHTAEHKLDDRTLTTEYYEPAAIPSSSSPPNTSAGYATTSPSSTRFPNGHSSAEEHGNFTERFYDRTNNTRVAPAEGEYIRRAGYHEGTRGRNRDRGFRNGPYNNLADGARHRAVNNSWPYTDATRYNNQANDTGYNTTPTDTRSEQSTKKKTKSRSGSGTPSPSGSASSRSPTPSRSRSSSSSSSSSGSRETSSTGSPKSRRLQSNNPSHQPVVHSEDRRPLAICVRNLPLRSSDTSLKDGLFHEYKKHGKVTWVKVVGQNSERHAIVCFKKPEDVEKALEVSYDKLFFGCKIEVAPYQGYDVEDNDLRPYEAEIDEFHPKATRTLFIGNLEKDVTASDLRKHFDQFGEIIEIDIKKQGVVSSYAFCQYSDIVSVVKAIRTMDGEHLNNNRIKLGFGKSMPTQCVWVDGVSDSVTDKYLSMQFDPFGIVGPMFVDREKGQALIFFDQVINAQTAVSKMRGVSMRGKKIQVDFASRECQEAFFENLEKQGLIFERPGFDERRDSTSRSFESLTSNRFSRYDTPTRPRTASYSSRSGAPATQCNTTAIPSPGTPGSATPRGTGSRSRLSRYEYYDQNNAEYPERHFRSYDEYSQGSGASHEDAYDHEYVYHESPSHLEPIEARLQTTEHVIIPFAQPDIRNLQKERVLLLEQLEECPSSGDELISPKKRLKLEHLDGTITSDVIIEANRDHRKVMEVRRSSDASLKHLSRRPSVDGKHVGHERTSYLPHAVCKRRKTAGSDSGRVHHYESSESVGGSRPGTPLCDERPEHLPPSEPRRIPREREGPLTLPLPRFASQVMGRGSVSVAGIKGQKENVLSSPPPAVTSPRISNPKPPSPTPVPPPASPPPRAPSLSSNSSDSDGASPSPSLDERIKSLDEKYEKWSGSRALSTAGIDALAKLDQNRERFRFKHKLLDLDLKEVQPSEIVKSVMAKRSVFDEDTKRLENVGEKYEPKDYNSFPRTPVSVQTTVPAAVLSTLPLLKVCTNPPPKTPTMLSPRSSGAALTPAKGLQYPFPTHPPMQPSPSSTTPTTPTPSQPPTSTTPRSTHGENRLKPCANASSDNWTPSKVCVNRSVSSSVVVSNKTSDANKNIPPTSECSAPLTQLEVKTKTNKVTNRRDSTNSETNKSRRNSETGSRRTDDNENCDSTDVDRLEKARIESERIEKENAERERVEKERAEKELERVEREREEKERVERERLEKERQERERSDRLEKERLERDRLEKERIEREKIEKERFERERKERERKEREERERREREDKERRERDEKERREREEKERREREEQLEREKQEKERRERREKEERDRREREDREKRDKEAQLEKERRHERDEDRKHKDDNHDKRNDHRHRENHSENRHKENNVESRNDKSTKDDKKDNHISRKDETRNSHDKNRYIDRDSDRRKDSVKENRDNNLHEKAKNLFNEIREGKDRPALEHHLSVDSEKNKDPSRRKERNNSLPATLGTKRRMSSHDALDCIDEAKKLKLSQEHRKISERRDSKDGKNKHKNSSTTKYEEKSRHNHIKDGSDEKRKDKEREHREDRHKNKQIKAEKQKMKSKNRDKDSRESPVTQKSRESPTGPKSPILDKDFLARLDLVEVEKQKQPRKDSRDKSDSDGKRSDDRKKEHKREDTPKSSDERSKQIKRDRIRKFTNSSENSDSDEPKKHSIFDIVEDEPAYISMYDKVKARSCKNMQKQEEEKRQEKIKAKFSQLKQSRAKREEKKRSTSWDEDSDSDPDRDKSDMSRRKSKMLIASSDDDDAHTKIKKEMFTDSDSDRIRCTKSEMAESSDEDRVKNLQTKGCKSRIMSESSGDEFNKTSSIIKTEIFSDNEVHDFADSDEKYRKMTEEYDDKYMKKERKNNKISELNQQIFGDSTSPEIKEEKFNNSRRLYDNSSADENMKMEVRKKHKKKQKRQKSALLGEEILKTEVESIQIDGNEKSKNTEKRKQHSKKDKKRDKSKDENRQKKSKKNKSDSKDFRRDGKMENIFGSLSDDSEGHKEPDSDQKANFIDRFTEDNAQSSVYASDSDGIIHSDHKLEEKERPTKLEEKERAKTQEKERFLKEEHRKRKEKKRREKEKRLREEQLNNENSMDYVDLGKQLEDNIKDDSNELPEDLKIKTENEETIIEDVFRFSEVSAPPEPRKDERKEIKEKKKKRKKSKDEKQRHHHHHHHHEKNKLKSPEIVLKKEDEIKVEVDGIFDSAVNKSSPNLDISISPPHREPLISPIAKTPTSSKEKKRDKFIPGFGTEIDEKIHENAVKSISEFDAPKAESPVVTPEIEVKVEKVETPEEKPRVIISQEETEDAVAALLGESFGSGQFDDYTETQSPNNEEQSSVAEENVQDDEEMRQAVQSLNSSELEIKPDTPQSEHDLQIDTDTEEQEDVGIRYDPPRTPDMIDFSQPPKTPDIPSYFRKESQDKSMPNIGSPPSLTPIKPPPPAAVVEVKRNLESRLEVKKTSPPSLPTIADTPRTVISQSWSEGKEKSDLPAKSLPLERIPPLTIQTSAVITQSTKLIATPTVISKTDEKADSMPPLKTVKPVVSLSLHNMPAQMPYPVLSQKESPKISTANIPLSRLPITSVVVSKPIQPTTVILPQAKVAQSQEVKPTQEDKEKSRGVFKQFPSYPPPRMIVQRPGLIIPNRQVAPVMSTTHVPPNVYGGDKIRPTLSEPPKLVGTAYPTEPPKLVSTSYTVSQTVPTPSIIITTTPTSTLKPFMPVIQEAPKLVSLSPQPSIIQTVVKPIITPAPIPAKKEIEPEVKEELLTVKEIPRTSTPSPVIVATPKVDVEKPKTPEPPKTSAIEKVTEELNLSLKKPEVKASEPPAEVKKVEALSEVVPPKKEQVVVNPEPEPKIEVPVKPKEEPEVKEATLPVEIKPEPENVSVIKEIEKFDDEKTETESGVSDVSKERLSADIKDDPLDSKEDSDYWSAKEVNIDSVIKKVDALCSADELSDRSSEMGKDDWLDDKTEVKPEEKPEDTKVDEADENAENIDEKEVSTRGGRRGGRARGRRARGGTERGGMQTRRGKVMKEVVPTRGRGGGRGGRPKIDRKVTKSESEDVYEFRDDSDESLNKDRPRLILTIKSPTVANANGNTAIVKEVIKEVITLQPPPKIEVKEEFASPANTRKSRRLQERDVSRNTVDDTIEDVVKNTVQTRAAAAASQQTLGARRSARQVATKPTPEINRKSPRGGKKKDRRASETTDDSSEEKPAKNELIKETVDAEIKEAPAAELPKLEAREKPHEGLKAAVLRRVKGDMNHEPMTLIDPVTGLLTPMRECEEGRYIPLGSQLKVAAGLMKTEETAQTTSVITPQISQQPTVAKQQKPQSLKAHVLAKAVAAAHQVPVSVAAIPPTTFPVKPLNQCLNVNVSLANMPPSHVSPRMTAAMPVTKPMQGVKVIQPPVNVMSHQQKQQIFQQVTKTPIVSAQMTHHKQQPTQLGKTPLIKPHMMQQQQVGTTPPIKQHVLTGTNARMMTKTAMEPPKVEVSIASGCVMVPRSNTSPQGQQRHVLQAGMPVPAYEASLGEGIAHFTPGSVPLRPPHDISTHYMHPPHVMYQYLRQQPYHLSRSPIVTGGIEKPGDGQEGEEAPVTSPPLELRRPGSVGLALSGRPNAVPHSLQSPHDRTTDSPQVGQVYNMHNARMQYHPGRYYEPGEPPPAHRPLTSHSSLAALGNERPIATVQPMGSHSTMGTHMGNLGTPDRPLSSHIPDRPMSTHLPDRPISTHLPDRPMSTHLPDRSMTGLGLGAVLGAAGNILGAVARHVGADAPASQRGLQAATPPHASQVPPQAESLLMLLKQYPLMWQGLLALKNDQAAVQMYFVSGNDTVAKMSLPKNADGSTPPLRIFQRMRLEPPQVEGVARKMQMENEHCMLLALPCGHDHMDVLKQSTNLTNGFITYLQQKQAAGIVNVAAPGTTQPPAYVVHIFPSCDFVNENLRRIAPSLLERVADIAHLLIVITTV